jgi:DNA-binding NarL/FixJ family response regulator
MLLQCVIVDDNEPFLKVARRVLERQGMAVVGVAANGAEALRQAHELCPDVALVDISLGAESGFDVGRQITPHVRNVILISSRDEDDYAELTTPCLRWALDLGQVSGIWGGTTEEERRAPLI